MASFKTVEDVILEIEKVDAHLERLHLNIDSDPIIKELANMLRRYRAMLMTTKVVD